MTIPRTGQAPNPLSRTEFALKFSRSFLDPSFSQAKKALEQIEAIAWTNYSEGHKAPVTSGAGQEFANPTYQLSVEWKATRDALIAAQAKQKDAHTQSRVLLICGSKPVNIRIRFAHPPLQGLRIDSNAIVPLALQLLP